MTFSLVDPVTDYNPQPVRTIGDSAQLITSGTLAATTSTGIKTLYGGSYIWAYQFTGTSPQLILEALGPDGTTYIQVGTTATATGSQGVVLGNNAIVRLRNGSGSNAINSLSSSLT